MIAFLSYSRADRGTVAHFDAELQRAGIDGWRDVEGIRGGEQWRTEIVEAIQHADAFVLFVSPAAMRSDNVRRELTVAEEDHKPIVPVLIEPSQVPEYFRYSLAGLEYIDVTALGSDEAFSRLHAALVALDGSHRPVTDVPAPPTPTSPTRRRVSPTRFRRSILIGVVTILAVVAVVAVVRERGAEEHPNAAVAGDSALGPRGIGARSVDVNKSFGYGAFLISLGKATFDGKGDLRIDAVFENLAPTDFAVGQEHISVVSGGHSYAWTGDLLPKVAGNAKSRGTLGFFIDGPLDLNDAVLVAGRSEQNQAVVPLGAQGTGKLLLPRNEQVSGTATAGSLTVDLVSAIVTAGDFEFNQNAPKGKVVVHLELQATTTERYGDNFIGNHLALETPNGEQATPLGGSNVVLAADAKASDLYADFAVPQPAMGKFVLVVRQQTESSPIPFTLS